MFSVLLLTVLASLFLCFCACIMEAAIFAVPLPHLKHLAEQGSASGRILLNLKTDIEKPITALLILNTIGATGGATLVGATAGDIYGEKTLVIISLIFACLMVLFAEFLPKVLGVLYCKQIAIIFAYPLSFLVKVFLPLIALLQFLSKRLKPEKDLPSVSQEEVLSMAALGTEEGALDHFEGSVITNVIGLDKILVRDILTPRVVVFRMPGELKIADIQTDLLGWQYTRVPLYSEDSPEHMTRYVRQRDIYREIVRGNTQITLNDLSRPLTTVPELARVDQILFKMFERNEQICAVVDEHGGFAGVLSLEDIIEEVVGHEISDEYDVGSTG